MIETNQIISSKDLILVRHKELQIEHAYLCSKFIEHSSLPYRLSEILENYKLPKSLCFNPFYNSWTHKLKYLITSNGFSSELNSTNWNETFIVIDDSNYNRLSILIFLEFFALMLLEDLNSQNEKVYIVNTKINSNFYIPGYLILEKGVFVKSLKVNGNAIFFDNHRIELNLVHKELNLGGFRIPFHSNLKFHCKDLPSVIINDAESVFSDAFISAFKLLNIFFSSDFKDLNLFSNYFFPIYSDDKVFFSGNDDYHLGLIYLPNINNEFLIAECIVHELMHQKLSNVERIKDLIEPKEPKKEGTYYSPWRDDPRPIRMVLHGLFVFTAIVEFWNNLIGKGVIEDSICKTNVKLRVSQNIEAIDVLQKEAVFSQIGELIFENLIKINSQY